MERKLPATAQHQYYRRVVQRPSPLTKKWSFIRPQINLKCHKYCIIIFLTFIDISLPTGSLINCSCVTLQAHIFQFKISPSLIRNKIVNYYVYMSMKQGQHGKLTMVYLNYLATAERGNERTKKNLIST